MAAFRLALEMGAQAVGSTCTDQDHELVVLRRRPQARGRAQAQVRDLTWKELSQVDMGSWRDRAFAAGGVPGCRTSTT